LESESESQLAPNPFGLCNNQLPAGLFHRQQQETKKREQWAEILLGQAKRWLTERGRKTADSVEQGLEYARSAAEQAAGKGVEYGHRLNPFHRETRRRVLGIL